jgi:hypothetical protein
MMRWRRPATRIAATAVVMALLSVSTGCAAGQTGGGDVDVDEGLTVTEAKAETMEFERDVASFLVDGEVLSSEQRDEGTLLSCSDDTHQWAGRITFQLDGSRSEHDVLEAVATGFTSQDGFRSTSEDNGERERILVSGPDGLAFVARVDDSDVLSVASASRCFVLRDGESVHDRY